MALVAFIEVSYFIDFVDAGRCESSHHRMGAAVLQAIECFIRIKAAARQPEDRTHASNKRILHSPRCLRRFIVYFIGQRLLALERRDDLIDSGL